MKKKLKDLITLGDLIGLIMIVLSIGMLVIGFTLVPDLKGLFIALFVIIFILAIVVACLINRNDEKKKGDD